MKLTILIPVLVFLCGVSFAEANDQHKKIPLECKLALDGDGKWQDCLDSDLEDHPIKHLAHMNIATTAFKSYDFEKAAKYYDLSIPEGGYSQSDIFLHTYRAASFARVGRIEDANSDTQIVNELLEANKFGIQNTIELTAEMRKAVLETHIHTLFELGHEQADTYFSEYLNFPVLSFYDIVNRAGLLTEFGRYEDAKPYSEKAVALAANQDFEANVLNNHCYLLALMKAGEEGVSFCEKAIELSPDTAGFYHSYSSALEAKGDCVAAQKALNIAAELEPSTVKFKRKIECGDAD